MLRFSYTMPYLFDVDLSPFRKEHFLHGLDWLAENEFNAAELCISDYAKVDISFLKNELSKRNLNCSTISTGKSFAAEGLSLSSLDTSCRKLAIQRIAQHISAAVKLNSAVTIGMLRGVGESSDLSQQMDYLCESLLKCAEIAREQGVTLLLEPINRYESKLLNSTQETVQIIEQLCISREVSILWDTFHANIEDEAFETVWEKYGNYIGYVHLADSSRAFPGTVKLDFTGLCRLLKARKYNGYLSFECYNIPSREFILKNAGEFIKKLKD